MYQTECISYLFVEFLLKFNHLLPVFIAGWCLYHRCAFLFQFQQLLRTKHFNEITF